MLFESSIGESHHQIDEVFDDAQESVDEDLQDDQALAECPQSQGHAIGGEHRQNGDDEVLVERVVESLFMMEDEELQ